MESLSRYVGALYGDGAHFRKGLCLIDHYPGFTQGFTDTVEFLYEQVLTEGIR